jgi:hypothetical protein
MSTHTCPGECGNQVPRHHYACRPCWYRLPEHLRTAIRRNHQRKTTAHAVAMFDAQNWYANNPLPQREQR